MLYFGAYALKEGKVRILKGLIGSLLNYLSMLILLKK
jgi:hypothetical protein